MHPAAGHAGVQHGAGRLLSKDEMGLIGLTATFDRLQQIKFRVPQAIQLSTRSLVWKRGAAPTPQVLRITLPKEGPITHITDAALSGDAFDYTPKVVKRGREYTVTITPRSTAKAALNRLVLTTDSTDPRYHRQIIYLQVKK